MKSQHQINYRKNNHPEIRPSSALRGGLVMISKSGGLKPKAVAGKPSVTCKHKTTLVLLFTDFYNNKLTKLTHKS